MLLITIAPDFSPVNPVAEALVCTSYIDGVRFVSLPSQPAEGKIAEHIGASDLDRLRRTLCSHDPSRTVMVENGRHTWRVRVWDVMYDVDIDEDGDITIDPHAGNPEVFASFHDFSTATEVAMAMQIGAPHDAAPEIEIRRVYTMHLIGDLAESWSSVADVFRSLQPIGVPMVRVETLAQLREIDDLLDSVMDDCENAVPASVRMRPDGRLEYKTPTSGRIVTVVPEDDIMVEFPAGGSSRAANELFWAAMSRGVNVRVSSGDFYSRSDLDAAVIELALTMQG